MSSIGVSAAASAAPPSGSPSSVNPWIVHKFGGTSLASSECYRNAIEIILKERQNELLQPSLSSPHKLCVVVSAMGEVKPNSEVGKLISSYHSSKSLSPVSHGSNTIPLPTPLHRVDKQDKVTNLLIRCTELAANNDPNYKTLFSELKKRHTTVIDELLNDSIVNEYQGRSITPTPIEVIPVATYTHHDHGENGLSELSLSLLHMKETLRSALEKDFDDLSFILRACWLSRTYDLEHNWWFGYGELWSARLISTFINAVLLVMGHGPGRSSNERSVWLDARDVLVLAKTKEPLPDFQVSQEKFDSWLTSSIEVSTANIIVITGYIASAWNGIPTTLGRDGSDYSASIFAALLRASYAVIWTDVDGVYSANPAQVNDAVLLDELSYDEASELAYFGAKVLHPKTMTPVISLEIPIWIRNTFNYSSRGSCILSGKKIAQLTQERERAILAGERLLHTVNRRGVAYGVKGFSEIGNLCLIEVKGTGVIGVPGIASRLFSRLRDANCSVILVTQAGSELSMCMAIPMSQADVGLAVVRREFRDELLTREILSVEKTGPCACLAVVGDGMRHKRGVAGRVFGALADAGVNVQAIAQGSSERNISAIIAQSDVTRAILAVHAAFLTPEGKDKEYSPLLKAQQTEDIDSTTKTRKQREQPQPYNALASPLLDSERPGAQGINHADAAAVFSLSSSSPSPDDDDEHDLAGGSRRLEQELLAANRQVASLKRCYRLFTRPVILCVCLIVGGKSWKETDISTLVNQLNQPWGERKEVNVNIKVTVDINSKSMRTTEAATAAAQPLDWNSLTTLVSGWNNTATNTHPLIIDCSDSEIVIRHYRVWLAAGVRLVTQRQLQSPLSSLHCLPVFATLFDLGRRKEIITRVEAVLPCPLSQAFTCPSSAHCLTQRQVVSSHANVSRMMVEIGLAMGCSVDDSSVDCDYCFSHIERESDLEQELQSYRQRASEQGMVYQYVASLEQPNNDSTSTSCRISIGLRLCPNNHPFGWLKGNNSCVMIYTQRSHVDPIVIQGPAAIVNTDGEGQEAEETMDNSRDGHRGAAQQINPLLDHSLGQFTALVADLTK